VGIQLKVGKTLVRSSDRAGVFHVPQVVLLALIAISIACSASKSASSPPQLTSNLPVGSAANPAPSSAVPQEPACKLALAEAPVVNRIKLGMTVDEVLALFPGSKGDAEVTAALAKTGTFGNRSLPITPSKYGNSPDFKNINRISFSLLDGRVSSFTINYNGPQWPDVDKFVDKFLEGRNLPATAQWEPYAGLETQMKTLTCTGFSIRVFSGGEGGNQNYVLLKDIEADNKLKERRKKAQAQASPTPGE
jgi:hypothetical protein